VCRPAAGQGGVYGACRNAGDRCCPAGVPITAPSGAGSCTELVCEQPYACPPLGDGSPATISGFDKVTCGPGEFACQRIITEAITVNCEGDYPCFGNSIIGATTVNCKGNSACFGSSITGATTVNCDGARACSGSAIDSKCLNCAAQAGRLKPSCSGGLLLGISVGTYWPCPPDTISRASFGYVCNEEFLLPVIEDVTESFVECRFPSAAPSTGPSAAPSTGPSAAPSLPFPRTKDDCKKGGWQTLYPKDGEDGHPFKNQGECVSWVVVHGGG